MYYYGYRYYSPVLGRFIDSDPIEERGGLNLCGFVGNDPVGRWDYLGKKAFSLRWVGDGVAYDGNNLWVGVWLWPESPPTTGYVIAKIRIKEAELKKCDGTSVSGNLSSGSLLTLDRFLESKFLAKYNPGKGDDGIHKGGNGGGGDYQNGIYFVLVNTRVFSDSRSGNGLVDCQKGKVVIEFSYELSSGDYGDVGSEWNVPSSDTTHYYDFKSFTNEAQHKPVRWGIEDDVSSAPITTITVDWNWCNREGKESRKVNKSPELMPGVNRAGR